MPEPLHTPEEWSEMYGLTVRDPDGWRTAGAPEWTEPVTLAEFHERAARSTCWAPGGINAPFARIGADLDRGAAAS